jgi:hypothetical protein
MATMTFALSGQFGVPMDVKAGTGTTIYEFSIKPASSDIATDDEWLRIDFVNANLDFSFTLDGPLSNPYSSALAPRDTPMQFLSLTLSNDELDPLSDDKYKLQVGMVLRWKYNNVTFNEEGMEFLIYRGDRWYEFDYYSELNQLSDIIAQSFPRSELMVGKNYISVFGGNPVTVPDEGDPRYNSFAVKYTADASDTTKWSFKLDRKQLLDIDIVAPTSDFNATVTRQASNPTGVELTTGLKGLYYFNVEIESDEEPGVDGLKYGAVLRIRYPNGMPANIEETTLNFVYFDGSKWNSFSQTSERSVYSKFVSQPTNTLLELSRVNIQIAVVAQEESVIPVPSTSTNPQQPQESPVSPPPPATSTPQKSTSNPAGDNSAVTSDEVSTSDEERQDSSSSAPVSMKIAALLLGLVVLLAL